MFCIGTRPEAIKLAPLILASKARNLDVQVVVTGQHHEMLVPFLEFFKIQVTDRLNVMQAHQSLSELTAKVLMQIQPLFTKNKPELLFVQGDTTTALGSALAAFYEKVPVVHVEAGLRTQDRYSPFPEEMNRKLIGGIAEYHFAPTETSAENLRREGITQNVWVTGNTGIDGLRICSEIIKNDNTDHPSATDKNLKTILVTCHRRENHGQPLENICSAFLEIVNHFEDTEIVFPVHLNPKVQTLVQQKLGNHPRIKLLKPLDYPDFVKWMQKSHILLTDSGGIQEEGPYFKKPILVMRESTDRPEGVAAGVAELVGSSREKIVSAVTRALTDEKYYQSFQKSENPYGDGFASEKILKHLGL